MTTHVEPADALGAPLDRGLLIEASAGTGKTYTLTTLIARLIVEEGRSLDELLIVTFTISAAGELRDRVWRTLHAARSALGTAASTTNGQAGDLARSWRSRGIPEEDAAIRLTSAIRDFDRANITTIHGFCQRALSEFALHAGLPFRFQVSGNDELDVASATRDFWRQNMASAEIPLLEYAKAERFVPEKSLPWEESVTAWVSKHHAGQYEIRGAAAPGEARHERQAGRDLLVKAFRATREAWNGSQKLPFLDALDNLKWNKNENDLRRSKVVEAFDADDPYLIPLKHAAYFGRTAVEQRLSKRPRQRLPDTGLFDLFERLGEAAGEFGSAWLAAQRRRLLEDVRETLRRGTLSDRSFSFNALLTELHSALRGENGASLAERIRTRYPVALIDEFQDTDRLQAEIFKRIFSNEDDTPKSCLFVVGDPKQSIFRFRGADVFAYLDARNRLTRENLELHLEQNYRSTPALIRAVNTLFAGSAPFVLPEFEFTPVQAAEGDRGELVVQGESRDPRPFQLQLYRRDDGKKWNKGELNSVAAVNTAAQIAQLLAQGGNGEAQIVSGSERRPVTEGDIAVLVRTGKQGMAIAKALHGHGIDSIEMGTENVFDSPEAAALYRLLHALCTAETEYNATPLLRGALAADLFGLNMQELASLTDDDDFWARWRSLARRWDQVWQEQGVAALIRHILFAKESNCAANLLNYPDGPRRLTNYLHVTDLLHEAETRRRPSRHGLVDWFRRSRTEPRLGDETAQLRLESDETLVKIVTVHRAKGLEFPLVFYPFAWDGRGPKAPKVAEYFDPHEGSPVLHLRPAGDACDRQRVEEHADELRLLYVALTRAKYRCVVAWAQARDAHHAPLAWLLHNEADSGDKRPIEALKGNAAYVGKLDTDSWLAEVHRFAGKAPDAIAVTQIDPVPPAAGDTLRPATAEAVKPRKARELGRPLDWIRQRTSYSALSTWDGAARSEIEYEETEKPDHDPVDPDANDEVAAAERSSQEEAPTVFTFPSGNRPGTCLHEIFERHLEAPDELDATCRDTLAKYRIDRKWETVARTLVEDTWATPLVRPGEAGSVFRLVDLRRPIAEMEFHLPVYTFERTELAQCLSDHGYRHSLPEDRKAISGFLHGYIDLVARHRGLWYVADYKSNWLGPDLGSYSPEALEKAMGQHGYNLQYLLYLTALHRLLRLRLPDYDYDRHIGGAFYLFLRGMRPIAPGSGVFHDRPSRACIEAIDACFGEAP